MNLFWLRTKLWTKVVVFAAVLVYVITFVIQNKDKTVELWFWYNKAPQQSLLVYTLIIFFLGIIAAVLARTIRGTARQFQQLRQLNAQRRQQERIDELERAANVAPSDKPPAPSDPK